MNEENILEAIEDRKKYPLLGEKNSEMEYIFKKLECNKDRILLVLPSIFLQNSREKDLRQIIFDDFKISGLFDLGAIFSPYTKVMFNLLVLEKSTPELVNFSKYLEQDTFKKGPHIDTKIFDVKNIPKQEISDIYKSYLNSISYAINNKNNPINSSSEFWNILFNDVSTDNLKINYYQPELIENENKLKQEITEPLHSLVEILKPRKIEGEKKGYVLKTKDFKYPIETNKIEKGDITSIKLQKGDILFSNAFNGTQKYYLLNDSTELYSSTFLFVLRSKTDKFSPEYLFLYLQSDVISKYFQRYVSGTVIQTIRLQDLKDLPIILPNQDINNHSIEIFKKLFLTKKENTIIQEINKELFQEIDAQTPPIQQEFIFEKIENLKIWKQEIIETIMKDDFKELEKAKNGKMYKSFLILAGSILEAFLLDWLSDEENYDYFSSQEDMMLNDLIWKLFSYRNGIVPDDKLYKISNNIRDKRNLIHPKKYFNESGNITDSICNSILRDLRTIFKKRLNNNL